MGTRAKVSFYQEEQHLVSVYYQFDGYLGGVGSEIVGFLKRGKLINGISGRPKLGDAFNGAGCLAASFISDQKTGVGGVYITLENEFQGYDYDVIVRNDKIIIKYEEMEYTISEFESFIKGENE